MLKKHNINIVANSTMIESSNAIKFLDMFYILKS